MTKLHYHRSMSAITTHSLLHLIFHIREQSQFIPVAKRNALLVAWLKKREKLAGYKNVKNDIKELIALGRKATGNLEERLWKLQDTLQAEVKAYTQADHLMIYFNDIAERFGVLSHSVETLPEEPEENTIYMLMAEIKEGINEANQLVRPLSFIVQTTNPDTFLAQSREVSEVLTVSFKGHNAQGYVMFEIAPQNTRLGLNKAHV